MAGTEGGHESQTNGNHTEDFVAPPRPRGLRSDLLLLYVSLAVTVMFFVWVGEGMKQPIPEGKLRKKDGTIIDIADFDPVALGPYPKCHPHFEQHQVVLSNGTIQWARNKDAPSGGPFGVGHPENEEWVARSDQLAKEDNRENRFKWKGLQPSLHLLALATLCVLLASKHGVWLFTEAPETREETQVLHSEDAYWFPIMGSGVLFGLFLLYKYLGTDLIKLAVSCGVVFMCIFGFGGNVNHLAELVRARVLNPILVIPYLEQSLTAVELAACCGGAVLAVLYIWSKNWIINNVFGISFSIYAIKMINLSSFKTGAIMLVGLFFYDVFWVFGSKAVVGSNVMVTVATGVEAPIKLLFPKHLGVCGDLKHSMLGLGDIAVPGIFLAFMAKWDAVKLGEGKSTSFVYLTANIVAYSLSLVTTVCSMLIFNAAQPALLYIVPYVLLTSLGVAVARGEMKDLWEFVIPDNEKNEANSAEEEKKNT